MKYILMLGSLLLLGCQDTNSNSFDKEKFDDQGASGDFAQSYSVLKTRCISCHYHSGWSEYKTSEDWVKQNLVTPQDVDNSTLIKRIVHFGGASSNMPVGEAGIPNSEYQVLVDWVEGLEK